jgi:hypothetical protein
MDSETPNNNIDVMIEKLSTDAKFNNILLMEIAKSIAKRTRNKQQQKDTCLLNTDLRAITQKLDLEESILAVRLVGVPTILLLKKYCEKHHLEFPSDSEITELKRTAYYKLTRSKYPTESIS